MIALHLDGSKNKQNNYIRGYWKINNTLLKDNIFTKIVKTTAEDISK